MFASTQVFSITQKKPLKKRFGKNKGVRQGFQRDREMAVTLSCRGD
jgi:hypothetical protein